MSFNLTASIPVPNSDEETLLDLVQTTTDETWFCLGWDGHGGLSLGRKLTWEETRDRYIQCLRKRSNLDPEFLEEHIQRVKSEPVIDFSYI